MPVTNKNNAVARRIAFLKEVLPFSELDETSLKAMLNDFNARKWAKGEIIFHQGDPSTELYVVYKGKVRIFKNSLSGKETSIVIFSEKSIIGEFAMIDGIERSATAKAVGSCELLVISKGDLMKWMEELFPLAKGMMRLVVSKARWTAAYAEIMAQYSVDGRFLSLMLLYKERLGREIEAAKKYELDLGLNQEELATLIGVRREWLNRRLIEWRKQDLLEHKRGKITILNLDAVKREQARQTSSGEDKTSW
ncbi:MAG: hypothetical protein B6I38_00530 [Anaerolineaceae bacterium 4572_5.1]|nr:MAG: hypothetical protein B6I38_00530 [Anaerolineaceae bacterium 4572_5.1]